MITLTREEAQQVLCAIQENWRTHEGDKAIEALRARLAQGEPEPVAWHEPGAYSNVTVYEKWAKENGWLPLYTAPPQRPWVGLTDEEIEEGQKQSWVDQQAWQAAVWWAEDKLREKNA